MKQDMAKHSQTCLGAISKKYRAVRILIVMPGNLMIQQDPRDLLLRVLLAILVKVESAILKIIVSSPSDEKTMRR